MHQKFEITVIYNYDTDETKLEVPEEIKFLPTIHQLDFLQDAIGCLQRLYDETLLRSFIGEIEGVDLKKVARRQEKLSYNEFEKRLKNLVDKIEKMKRNVVKNERDS